MRRRPYPLHGATTLAALFAMATLNTERDPPPEAPGRRRFTAEELAACTCPPLEEQLATGAFVLCADCPTHGERGPKP